MKQMQGRGRRAAVAALVVMTAALAGSAGHVRAFAPTNWKSFGSNSHQSITEDSVTALDKEFFSVSKLTKTMKKAMGQIVDANAAVDGDQTHTALHFDGENFAGGQQRVVDLFNRTLSDIRAKNAQAARTDLGGALHTIQDFYAHSNWIELGNAGPNPDLGRPGHVIGNVAAPNENTCNGSTLTTTHLTSGYYGGEDRTPPAGVQKCRHGGPLDDGPGSGGINKDFRLTTLSPHAQFHDAAAAAARQATDQFIRDIKAQITQAQLRLLLGAGPVLGMAIDTTGSMGDIIAGVKSQAISIVDARLGTDEEPSSYVLSPFNDPSTGPVSVTDDAATFKSAISSLFASGGGDCPELSQQGMLAALSSMDKGGDLFMFTDASSKDASLAGNVSSLATTNEVSVYPVLFGSCSPIDPAYLRVAADSGGQVFVLARSDAGQITKLADFVVRANAVDVLAVAGDLSAGARTYTVPVDSTMTRVTFSTSGASNVVLTRPDGSVVAAGDPGVQIVSLTGGAVPAKLVSVTSPAVGSWSVQLSGGSSFSLNVSGESSLDLTQFRFVHEIPGREGPFDVPITGFPVAGAAARVEAELGGEFANASFDFRAVDGSPLQTLSLTQLDGVPEQFSGDVTPGATPFRVYVTGTDAAGDAFQRALPSTIQPQALVVTPPASADLHAGQTTSFAFQVQNLGPADTFRVTATDDKRYLQTFSPSTLTLGTNETGTVTVQLRPPASVPDGTSDTLSVDVASIANPAVHNFAVVTNAVAASDTTPPSTTATITPAPNAAGWNNSDVTVTLQAFDNAGGTGVKSITYSVGGTSTTVDGDTASIPVTTEGTTTITFAATDNAGNAEAPQSVTVQLDKTPPTGTCQATPDTLWPPNHKLVDVSVLVTFTDPLSGATGFQLVSAGADDAIAPDDIVDFTLGTPDVLGSLRAERAGNLGDRVYTLTYEASDAAGNTGRCSATVTVPHDQR